MDRMKKLLILLGVLVAICAVTFGISKYEKHKENIQNTDEDVVEIDPEEVTALSWENDTSSLSFTKTDDTWTYDEDENFPVSVEAINELLEIFNGLQASFIIENVEDYSQYGLDDPEGTITITCGEEVMEVQLGDYSKMDSQRYISTGDGNVYLVTTDPLDSYSVELSAVADNDTVPDFSEIKTIVLDGNESYTITYDEDTESYSAEVNGETVELDSDLVESYISTLSSLSTTDYVTYNASDDDLVTYGLNEPDLTVTVNYTEENEDGDTEEKSFIIHIARDPEEAAAEEASEEEENEEEDASVTAYARIGESQIVYSLSTTDYLALMLYTSGDLRHQYVYYGDFEDITNIEVTIDGENYSIESKEESGSRTYYYDETELDTTSLSSAMTSLLMDEFVTEAKSDQGDKQEIKLVLTLEDESTMEIEINQYDGSSCEVLVDGSVLGYATRSSAVNLVEAIKEIVL